MTRPKISRQKNSVIITNKGQFRVAKRTQKDYTIAFKLHVVEEVESRHLTQKVDCRKYGIQATSSVLTWIRKHGRINWHQNTDMSIKNLHRTEK